MGVFKSMEDEAKKVRYSPDDEPNKYGYTEKMTDIWHAVEDEKGLESIGFKPNEYDKAYYEESKHIYEMVKDLNGGKKTKIIRFENDIDPE